MWWLIVKSGGDSGALRQVSDIGGGFERASSTGRVTRLSSNCCQAANMSGAPRSAQKPAAPMAGSGLPSQPLIHNRAPAPVLRHHRFSNFPLATTRVARFASVIENL